MRLPLRARRRLHLENLQRKARLRAERGYAAQGHVHSRDVQRSFLDLYSQGMYAQGKFFNGGCGRARCGLCDYTTPRLQQRKLHNRFDDELREYFKSPMT